MFRNRLSYLLKEGIPSESISDNVKPSIGRRILRGAMLGGLAGGLIATAIEMTPEEYGIKQKVENAIAQGQKMFETTKTIPDKPLVVAKSRPSPPVEELKKPQPEPPKEKEEKVSDETRDTLPPTTPSTSASTPSVSIESLSEEIIPPVMEDEPVMEIPSEGVSQPLTQEMEAVTSADELLSTAVSTTEDGVPVDQLQKPTEKILSENFPDIPPVDPSAATIAALEAEVARLKSELESEKKEHELDLARAAGGAQASLETIDRMYNEREVAMSVARQSLLVTDLLEQLARDDMQLSPGSLKTDFHAKKDKILESCFLPPDVSLMNVLLSKIFSSLYSLTGGKIVAQYGDDDLKKSPTWRNLRALHLAEIAIDKNQFRDAMNHLAAVGESSREAGEWVDKTRQALELWQGSRAALASMHDELSRVL